MACFADINVSQGSVATNARCGGIFDIHLTANLPGNMLVKNRLRFDRIMVMSLWPRFLAHPVEYGTLCLYLICRPTRLPHCWFKWINRRVTIYSLLFVTVIFFIKCLLQTAHNAKLYSLVKNRLLLLPAA